MPDHCNHMADYWYQMYLATLSYWDKPYHTVFCECRYDYYLQKAKQ